MLKINKVSCQITCHGFISKGNNHGHFFILVQLKCATQLKVLKLKQLWLLCVKHLILIGLFSSKHINEQTKHFVHKKSFRNTIPVLMIFIGSYLELPDIF